jgi:hypothetical protein
MAGLPNQQHISDINEGHLFSHFSIPSQLYPRLP